MKIRLSGDVVAADRRAWVAGRSGPVEIVDEPALPLGSPVALGPDDARADQVKHAVDELGRLVAVGGVDAAGAGVYLGSGFRSARLAGARGDQRDAVLAALRVLGVAQADRLGDRGGYLVALFGLTVTKRVGAAAAAAISEGRWDAVTLASAASDVLGPEQLESILALDQPPGVDLVPGPASTLAQYLRRTLDPVPRPRRLDLLLDLWAQVRAHHAQLAQRARLLATQSKRNRTEDLHRRRQYHDDQVIIGLLRSDVPDPEERLADVARWKPLDHYWRSRLEALVQDAFAATALLRTAVAVGQHGLDEGLARSAGLLRAAEGILPVSAATAAARRVQGQTGLPIRPGTYVRDINRRLSSEGPRDHRFEGFIRPRLACARDFAMVIMRDVAALLDNPAGPGDRVLRSWAEGSLQGWRKDIGYSAVRVPGEWGGIPRWSDEQLAITESLADRLAGAADATGPAGPAAGSASPASADAPRAADAASVELVGDLLWYAELADALAALYGHRTARGPLGIGFPWFDYDPQPENMSLTPRLDSVTLAVAGAAQLAALGGTVPKRAKTWSDLTGELLASTAVAAAITGEFAVPPPLAAQDGAAITGTGLHLRVARNARTLADWSDYMGNCIAGSYYVERAKAGRSILTGLYDRNDVLIVNAELVARRPTARGWRVEEIQARFNQAPDESIERRFREWVEAIPGAGASEDIPPSPDEVAPAQVRRRRSVPRLVEDAGPALDALARQAWEEEASDQVLGSFAALAGTTPSTALARLRRLQSGALAAACQRSLDAGTVGLDRLWVASGVRPLRTAVARLDPALSGHFDQLSLLFGEPPMAKSLRKLVALPAIADAYALDRVARSVRRALGDLTIQGDEAVARSLADRPAESLLCALTVLVTCRAPAIDLTTVASPSAVTVPGYPATALDDESGPWQRTLPDAQELGADTSVFWDEIAKHGLRVPAAWLAGGSWAILWGRAHR